MTDDPRVGVAAEKIDGLTSLEASARLLRFGPNSLPVPTKHRVRRFLRKLWGPVPGMLEVTIVMELSLGRRIEALVIGALLAFNAVLAFFQEGRAENALMLLRKRLPVKARILRDSRWRTMGAEEIVPGDEIYLRMGDVVPADVRIGKGELSLDQSMLTGESLPVDATEGSLAYAGSIVKRGEASGEVSATGQKTYFGKTAELVSAAKTVSHLQTLIFTIVKYLVSMDLILASGLILFAYATGLPLREVFPFVLILLVASVPIALPATFTLATAVGSLELARNGVMVTRLSAIEEAAAMDVLLVDKTGTITLNRLTMVDLLVYPPFDPSRLLRLAALASDRASQDPIDLAILAAADIRSIDLSAVHRMHFAPFDTASKMSGATFVEDGVEVEAIKGFPAAVAARAIAAPPWRADVERLAARGCRVIAVAEGSAGQVRMAGLIAFEDLLRPDSNGLIKSLRELGIRVMMVTGDTHATAASAAAQAGIGDRICGPEELAAINSRTVLDHDVFAGVFPEDKVKLVRAVQATRVAGMTGDGVNDAPALRQAEVGIAVANATDVAKAAASVVLTSPGLGDILAAVKTSRRIYQRMLTYTLNKIVKTMQISLLLSAGLVLTRTFIVTPLLVVLLLFANDFVTMSISTDNVSPSLTPDHWDVRKLMLTAGALAILVLAFSLAVVFAGRDWLHLPLRQLQTLVFAMLVFTGQGTVYLVRERERFWRSRPGMLLILSSAADVVLVTFVATRGILMAGIQWTLIAWLLAATLLFMVFMDIIKVRIFRAFAIR